MLNNITYLFEQLRKAKFKQEIYMNIKDRQHCFVCIRNTFKKPHVLYNRLICMKNMFKKSHACFIILLCNV